jgi:molybdopterin/thiamine biosynthesis adenylyltransferase
MPTTRYNRQTRFVPIGEAGQNRLAASRVAIVGCGALGTVAAEQLARAGVGFLRIIDRDFVDETNLQRQTLFSEDDARQALPKAVAAKAALGRINSSVAVQAIVADLDAGNVIKLIDGCDLVIDGCDNFHTKHVLNDACCKLGMPWIYGACVGSYGLSMPIVPGDTACLHCLQDQLPAPGETPTCDTAGVIAPIVHVVAAWQVAEALKLLIGATSDLRRELWTTDLWSGKFQRLRTDAWRDPTCASCGAQPSFPYLQDTTIKAVTLCGRDALQLWRAVAPDLERLRTRIGAALISANEYLIRWRDGDLIGTCFRDGRVMVQGTADVAAARTFCDRWLG